MKILVLLNSPNWSGASYYCLEFAYQMQIRGHKVLLLTEPGKPLDRAKELKINVLSWLTLNSWQIPLLKSIKRIIITTLFFKPDFITSHINEAGWVAGFIKKFYFPSAITIRFRTDIPEPKRHFINKIIHNQWYDHIVVSSNLHKNSCIKNLALPPNKLSVIYAPINHKKFSPILDETKISELRTKLNLPQNEFLIGLVARLDPVKGHEYALKALSLLPNNLPIKLVLVYYESQRNTSWLYSEISKLDLSNRIITFNGFRTDIENLIQAFDIGIITSIGSEANCRVALEFMSCQKPVIATRVGVIPEIINNFEDGILISPQSYKELADSIYKLYTNSEMRQNMGLKARHKIIQNFNLELFSDKMEKLLFSLKSQSL